MDPFTIAAGISAVGSIFKGITGLFGGIHANQAAKANARQANDEAAVAGDQALMQGDAVAARAATQAAANGGGFTGSSLGVISSLSQQAMFNARAQIYRGQTQARDYLYEGKQALTQGIQGAVGAGIQAGSSLLGGFAQSAAQARQLKAIQSLGSGGYGGGGDNIDLLGGD